MANVTPWWAFWKRAHASALRPPPVAPGGSSQAGATGGPEPTDLTSEQLLSELCSLPQEELEKALEIIESKLLDRAAKAHDRGMLNAKLGLVQEAVNAFEEEAKLLSQSDDDLQLPDCLFLLGFGYGLLGRQTDGARSIRVAMSSRPESALLNLIITPMHWPTECWARAVADYRGATQSAPYDADAAMLLGFGYIATGRHSEAIEALSSAAKYQPRDEAIQLSLGLAYWRASDNTGVQRQCEVLRGLSHTLAEGLAKVMNPAGNSTNGC